jgi:hypothetical protein
MEDWCNYSDLPSPDWWERLELIEKAKKCIREDLHGQVESIITLSDKKDLNKIEHLLKSKIYGANVISNVCIELDFLASKLKYFKKLDIEEMSFGVDFEMIPELIAKWRDEKLDNIL